MKLDWLDRDLMRTSCSYILCLNEETFAAVLKHIKAPASETPPFLSNWHSHATTHRFENQEDGVQTCVVCLGKYEGQSGTAIAALLVHEAVHIWQKTCRDYGETEPGEECEAYAIQCIAQSLMESFARQTK